LSTKKKTISKNKNQFLPALGIAHILSS